MGTVSQAGVAGEVAGEIITREIQKHQKVAVKDRRGQSGARPLQVDLAERGF